MPDSTLTPSLDPSYITTTPELPVSMATNESIQTQAPMATESIDVNMTTQLVAMGNDSLLNNGSVTSEMDSMTTEVVTTATPQRDLEVILILDGDCQVAKATEQHEAKFKKTLQVRTGL